MYHISQYEKTVLKNNVHAPLIVQLFVAKHGIILLEHPSYSPDLAPCDFFCGEGGLKRIRLDTVIAVKKKASDTINVLS